MHITCQLCDFLIFFKFKKILFICQIKIVSYNNICDYVFFLFSFYIYYFYSIQSKFLSVCIFSYQIEILIIYF